MNKAMIEAMAQERGWVVKYALDGTPSFFYPIYKCTSKSLDPSLPDRTHPAFIVNGQEIDRLLIGVYKGSFGNNAVHSLPMRIPHLDPGHDEFKSLCIAAGPGFTVKTVAVSGLLLLMAKKYGWDPKGNTWFGVDSRDATPWELDKVLTSGSKRAFRGWEYTCNAGHTTSLANQPHLRPDLWQRGKFIGGIPIPRYLTDQYPSGLNTVTGSGPASWSLDGTVNGIVDLVGNMMDQDYGYRVVSGELQVIENNNAMHPDTDTSATSLAWKAILPHAANNTHTLVAPGTPGTLKWDIPSTVPVLAKTITNRPGYKNVAFNALTKAADLPYVPALLQELGLYPVAGDTSRGRVYYDNAEGIEYIPRRGGNYYSTSNAGLGFVSCINSRGGGGSSFGVRSAFLENL